MGRNYNTNQLTAMKRAYIAVFNGFEEGISDEDKVARMTAAVEAVREYPGKFSGEDDVLADRRRGISGDDAAAYIDRLSEHLKGIGFTCDGRSVKGKFKQIYMMHGEMNSSDTDKGVEDSSPAEDNADAAAAGQPGVDDGSDKVTENKITAQERNEKSMEQTMNSYDRNLQGEGGTTVSFGEEMGQDNSADLLKSINDAAAKKTEQVAKGSNVNASTLSTTAVRKRTKDTESERKARADNTRVERLVLSTKPQLSRLRDGKDAKGHIPAESWERIFRKFCENTGCKEKGDGSYEFSSEHLAPGEEENAKAMLEILMSARDNPVFEIEINESKSAGAIKGFMVNYGDAGRSTEYVTKDELRNYILANTSGYVRSAVSGTIMQISGARGVSASKNKKRKTSDNLVDLTNVTDIKDIVILKIIGRKAMVDAATEQNNYVEYWREIDERQVEELPGCRSAVSVKCIKKPDKAGEASKKFTYRLPLVAPMYKTVVSNESLRAKFGEGGGIGQSFNPDDAKQVESLFNNLQELLALAADAKQISTAGGLDILADIRKDAAGVGEATKNEQADAVGSF